VKIKRHGIIKEKVIAQNSLNKLFIAIINFFKKREKIEYIEIMMNIAR